MNPNDPINEHCCEGRTINFDICDDNSHFQTGVFQRPIGTVVQFCVVFFGEESFKNNVDKRRLVLV